eukprot:scaffold66426_cov71-Phaeocystis_antarctica.AAC.3
MEQLEHIVRVQAMLVHAAGPELEQHVEHALRTQRANEPAEHLELEALHVDLHEVHVREVAGRKDRIERERWHTDGPAHAVLLPAASSLAAPAPALTRCLAPPKGIEPRSGCALGSCSPVAHHATTGAATGEDSLAVRRGRRSVDALEIWPGAPLGDEGVDPLAVRLHREHAHAEVCSVHARGAVRHTHLNDHSAPWLRMARNEHVPKLVDAR